MAYRPDLADRRATNRGTIRKISIFSIWSERQDSLSKHTPRSSRTHHVEANMLNFARNFLRDDSGATAIEYGLIAALIAVAIITAATTVGGNLATTFTYVAGQL